MFYTQNGYFSIFEGVINYDVIVTSYINGWYLFWHHWKEDDHTVTLVVNLGLYDLQDWYSGGGCNNPPSENIFGKTPQDNKG